MDTGLEDRAPPLTFGDPVVEYAESHGATGTSFRSGVRILDTLTATARTPAYWVGVPGGLGADHWPALSLAVSDMPEHGTRPASTAAAPVNVRSGK